MPTLLEQIEHLTLANREARDPDLDARVLQLRYEALEELRTPSPPPPWPPRVDDLFHRVRGVPDIDASELTVEALRSAVFRHGSLLVRGLVDHERCDALIHGIDRAFAARDAFVAGAAAAETAPWYVPFEPTPESTDSFPRAWMHDTAGLFAVDSPSVLADTIDTFETAGIGALVTRFLGERPALLAKKWTLRRVPHDLGAADWHQDGAFMGADVHSLNVWLSLSRCGEDAPGLEILAKRLDHIVETGRGGASFDWSVGPGSIRRRDRKLAVRPRFEPGDVLCFDHMLLHRTGLHPSMTRDRYAIEAWFAAPSAYPVDQFPIAY